MRIYRFNDSVILQTASSINAYPGDELHASIDHSEELVTLTQSGKVLVKDLSAADIENATGTPVGGIAAVETYLTNNVLTFVS